MAVCKDVILAFDLDDTLYKEWDFVRSGWMAVAKYVADLNRGQIEASELFDIMQNANDAFDALSDYLSEKDLVSISVQDMLNIYRSHIPTISLDSCTENVLNRLLQLGYTIAIITDGRSVTQHNKIDALRLDRYTDIVIVSEDIGYDKNTPEPFKRLNSYFGNMARYVYIGDNPAKDFRYPNLMGWRTIMLKDNRGINIHTQSTDCLPDEFKAQQTINSIKQLLDVLLPYPI
jgi:putative hydrolase of the HAD superfamily